jgi:hypothetical protein
MQYATRQRLRDGKRCGVACPPVVMLRPGDLVKGSGRTVGAKADNVHYMASVGCCCGGHEVSGSTFLVVDSMMLEYVEPCN